MHRTLQIFVKPLIIVSESNIVCFIFLKREYVHKFFLLYIRMFTYLFKTVKIMFLSFIRYELLDVENGNPISHKMSNEILWLLPS